LRIYDRYILYLAIATGVLNVALAFAGQEDLGVYFAINVIAYLVITLLYVYLNPRARRALDTIGYMLFSGFLVIVAIKVAGILSGR
jgi:TRAP-type C4-dicarboxylate transport system permease small subunit